MQEVECRVGSATYGICCPLEAAGDDQEKFTYVAAVAAAHLDDIPHGMVGIEVPDRDYEVFAYDGGIGPALPETVRYIFGDWLPNSGFVQDGYDFEYYDDRFDPQTDTGTFFIYVPVKRKAADG
jgi:predicted transcriptional regulator YdeE